MGNKKIDTNKSYKRLRRGKRKNIKGKRFNVELKIIMISLIFISIVGGTVFKVYGQDEGENEKDSVVEVVENTQGEDITDAGYNDSSISDNNINDNETNDDKESSINDKITEGENSVDDAIKYKSLENDIYASDSKIIEDKINRWNFINEDNKKIAYLTFDDGPSATVTPQILDILKTNNVKATFFVLGSEVEKSQEQKEMLKRIVKEGNAIGNHGYSHRYDILYPNGIADPQAFMNDVKKSESVLKSVLGEDFNTRVLRMPGGHASWNTKDLDNVLEEHGYTYIDWNVINGDAESNYRTESELISELKETVSNLEGNNDTLVVLMHDKAGKENTAKSLQEAIDYLRSLGYEFKTLK